MLQKNTERHFFVGARLQNHKTPKMKWPLHRRRGIFLCLKGFATGRSSSMLSIWLESSAGLSTFWTVQRARLGANTLKTSATKQKYS